MKPEVVAVGRGRKMNVIVHLNEALIMVGEVQKSVREMKAE